MGSMLASPILLLHRLLSAEPGPVYLQLTMIDLVLFAMRLSFNHLTYITLSELLICIINKH